jgi:hypothetical protein
MITYDDSGNSWDANYGSPEASNGPITVGGSNIPTTIGGTGGAQISSYPPNTGNYLPADYLQRMQAFVAANPGHPEYGTGTSSAPATQQSNINPFMPAGMSFQPHTQFGQQASAPLNIGQQGRSYGQMPGGPNMPQQTPAFQSMHPGGSSGFMPQFQNPFGPQAQPQQYRPMGQQPTQISQQPQQLDDAGIAALMRNAMQAR